MNNGNEVVIELSRNDRLSLMWYPARQQNLQMVKNGSVVFSARADKIYEWDVAPDRAREKAINNLARAGKTANGNTLIACEDFGCNVLTVTTQEIADKIRRLIPEAIEIKRKAAAEREANEAKRKAELQARRDAAIAACPPDCEPCKLGEWFDGIQTYIAISDGTKIQQWDGADAHGCGIVYIEKSALDRQRGRDAELQARRDAAEREEAEKRAASEAAEREAFSRAAATGEKQLLRTWVTERCMNGNDDDCSFDNAYLYAMPDGTRKTQYVCCH